METRRELLSQDLDKWTERRDWHQSAMELCDRRVEAILGEMALLRGQTIQLVPSQREGEA